MKILITGNRGFVGNATEELLWTSGHEVVGYDIMDGRDIRDFNQLCEVIQAEQPDRILHLAAIARFQEADANPILAYQTNIKGTENVIMAARQYHIPVVFASTGSTYMPIKSIPPITEEYPVVGNSVYGCTKAIGDHIVQTHNPHIILRYAHLYGAEKRYHGLIGGFLSRIEFGMEPVLYGGKQSNDFMYIKDVALINKLALEAPWDKWNQAYNAGTGEELTAEEAGQTVCEVFGYKGEIQRVEGRTVDAERFFYDMSKAEKMLGFVPQYNFRQGLQDMKKVMAKK
jgi:nucleoside-diphosphate-sugar epimerase